MYVIFFTIKEYEFELYEYYTSTDCMSWKIKKTYSHFVTLYGKLNKEHPNFSLPQLPPKGNNLTTNFSFF